MTPEQFLTSLRARGVEVSVRNNRLQLFPGVTWRKLTVDEAECVSAHRADIKRLAAADGSEPAPTVEPKPGAAPAEPTPEPVVWKADYTRRITPQDLIDAGVVGRDRAAYERAEMWLRERAREERSKRATATMFESIRRQRSRSQGGYRE